MRILKEQCQGGVVLDASVLINLIAADEYVEIVRCIPNAIITEFVTGEATICHRPDRDGASAVRHLIDSGVLAEVRLDSEDAAVLVDLVGATPPDDLDDGEASSIAYAARRGLCVALDDRKARRIVRERFSNLGIFCAIDIYREIQLAGFLPSESLELAVFDSLRFARMRVPAEHQEWVVNTIGNDRVPDCPSLPSRLRMRNQGGA